MKFLLTKNKNDAFTLIEILLVVLLIALCSSLVGYRFYHSMDRTTLRISTNRVSHTVRYARLLAAEHHKTCDLHIDMDNNSYWLTVRHAPEVVGKTPDRQDPDQQEEVVNNVYSKPSVLEEKLRFVKAQVENEEVKTSGQVIIRFYVDGSADAALVQIGSADETFTLLVQPWTAEAILKAEAIDELPIDTINLGGTGQI
ncbi:MAG: prepilin-type N-terminal cleavage/methylation domain-containing protein [Sedimentisphaerales bacterium]|nr:prepilin-type N-terminal cleavage/methylation domain-containing protein [Sedimentisphaerales bacterium]